MPLTIRQEDIRNIKADIAVNPTDRFLSASKNIVLLINQFSNERLNKELSSRAPIEAGEAIITDSFGFGKFCYIIHTCVPHYIDGQQNEEGALASCFRNSLALAKEKNAESIVFPLISADEFNFPKGRPLKVATDVITSFLQENEMNVFLLVDGKDSFDTADKLFLDVKDYLERKLRPQPSMSMHVGSSSKQERPKQEKKKKEYDSAKYEKEAELIEADYFYSGDITFEPDESFSECLVRMIDERKLKDPEVYKRANIDRKHFNHIINTKNYQPKKETAIALAIGMKLNLNETKELLNKAGFALSDAFVFDQIIRYCIRNRIYNIFDINELLFKFDQKTLGC